MTQLELFDQSEKPAKLSRKSDPITSQQSAAGTEKKLNTLHQSFLCCLGILNCPSTANEVAVQCVALDGGMSESYRKRAKELVDAELVEQAGERRCEITGKNAMTFRVRVQK